LDIAFMYLPSESIFQEVTYAAPNGVDSLVEYALRKRVVPVSPNTLYAYLCVIRMGLRGFDLQQNAREVLQHLTHLGAGVEELRSELGTAIRQARHSLNNLTDADRALRKVEERLELVSGLRKGEGLTTARTNESGESGEAGAV
ncbi:MAG: DNA recombination protein RmuC, partial [Gemmatimonadota bacterium]